MIFSDFSQSNIGISQQESMKWGFDKINGGFHQQRDFTLFLKESTRGSTKGGQKKIRIAYQKHRPMGIFLCLGVAAANISGFEKIAVDHAT